jgi:serine/threonine-protein kinase RsbW
MTTAVTELVLRSDPQEVPGLQSRLLALCTEAGLDELGAFQLTTAIVEAVNNCIEHAYGGEPGHQISLRWLVGPESVVVEIRDTGRAMRSDEPQPGDTTADVDAVSGRGWHIIRQWTSTAVYESDHNGNLLTLTRCL